MDCRQVLIKTAKGQEEIRTKAFKLSPRLRRFLILVDGHSRVEEFLARYGVLGDDIEAQLDALVADGFLAPRNAADNVVEIPQGAQFNLEKAKGFARFIVLGSLGPAGARRAERIEAAKTPGELRVELDELREALPRLLSKRIAKAVWEQLEPLILSLGERTA